MFWHKISSANFTGIATTGPPDIRCSFLRRLTLRCFQLRVILHEPVFQCVEVARPHVVILVLKYANDDPN